MVVHLNPTNYEDVWVVPLVFYECGSGGFAQDWTDPGPCPHCGAAFAFADMQPLLQRFKPVPCRPVATRRFDPPDERIKRGEPIQRLSDLQRGEK